MTCNSRCQGSSKDKKYCRCSCHGVNHGGKNENNPQSHDMIMSIDMGGEIKEFLESIKDKKFRCQGICNKIKIANDFLGYGHDGGIADKNGKKFWVYYQCEKCGYQTSYWKVKNAIERLKKEETHD